MEIEQEFILHPRPEEIQSLRPEQVLDVLISLWSENCNIEVPDFDRLCGAGQLARFGKTDGVQTALIRWLQLSSSPKKWDVAASFLIGYWGNKLPVMDAMVSLLVEALKSVDRRDPAADTLIMAVGAAYPRVRNSGLAAEIESVFQSLWLKHLEIPFPKSTAESIQHVTNSIHGRR